MSGKRKQSGSDIAKIEGDYDVVLDSKSDKELNRFLKESGFPLLGKALRSAKKKRK